MKKFLLSIIAVLFTYCGFSSHLVGGDLHYVHLGGDNYRIILKVYRDCENSTTNFDSPASVGIFNNGILVLNVEIYLAEAVISSVPANANDPCLIPPTDICVMEAIYTQDIVLPYVPGGYVLAYQRCCRTAALVNVSSFDDIGMTLTTTIPDSELVGYNSNPDFLNFPPIAICLGNPFTYDHSAIDIDGDSISYELCSPLLGGGFGSYYLNPPNPPPYSDINFVFPYSSDYPIAADPEFVIDPITGELTGTPDQIGVYVVGVCINEYRDGVLISSTNRDFQFNVVICGSQINALLDDFDPCDPGLTVPFTSNAVAAENYLWDFGDPLSDEDFAFELNPSWEYSEPGIYEASVIINAGLPCVDTAYVDVEVYNLPDIGFEIVDFYCDGEGVIYDYDISSENADDAAYYWFFGGGAEPSNYSGIDPPGISYSSSGDFSITLTIVESPCQSVLAQDIEIEPFPIASIWSGSAPCDGLTVEFDNLSSGAITYNWNFGDPNSTTDQSEEEFPTYTYTEFGTYTVVLVVNEGSSCENTVEYEVEVFEVPNAEFDIASAICEDGQLILSIDSPEGNSETSEYSWNFSDFAEPSASDSINPGEIVFTDLGNYEIILTVSDGPCVTIFSEDVYYNNVPDASIEPQTEFCLGLEMSFVNSSVNSDFSTWDFGDGIGTSFSPNPSYLYPEYGTYVVTLTSSTVDCDAIDEVIVEILPTDPIDFSFDLVTPPNCDESTGVQMIWTGEGADQVSWEMGEGSTYEGFTNEHFYDEIGVYNVTVTALHDLCDYVESGSGSVEIAFFVLKEEIIIPNIFSPNDDDFNEEFRIFFENYETSIPNGKGLFDFVEDYSMTIFNRWGTEVFSSNDKEDTPFWNGSDADEGTYFYIITYKRNCMDDDVVNKSGYFQLVR